MKRSGIVVIIAGICIVGLTVLAGAEDLKIGVGGAPIENILKPVRAAFESATGIKLYIVSSGPKNAFSDLQKGDLDAAAAGLTYQDWLAMMKNEGAEVRDPSAYVPLVVGKDMVQVIVNKDNKIRHYLPSRSGEFFPERSPPGKRWAEKTSPFWSWWASSPWEPTPCSSGSSWAARK